MKVLEIFDKCFSISIKLFCCVLLIVIAVQIPSITDAAIYSLINIDSCQGGK